MAVGYNPRIVTDGLVLALDAGNTKSYPGSGTSWRDLSGRRNNGTLTNGPTYSSANSGSIVFDGTKDYINFGSRQDANFGTGDFAVECWFYDTGSDDYAALVVNGQSGGSDLTAFQLGRGGNSNGEGHIDRIVFIRGPISESFFIYDSVNTIQLNTWTYVAATRIGTTVKLYTNAVEVGSMTDNGSYSNTALRVGRSRGTATYWSGRISNVRLYKGKGLTASEISQNFNALRGRFGI